MYVSCKEMRQCVLLLFVRPLIAVGHQRLSIAARIEQFYRDVKQKSKELYSENEYDTRYNILGQRIPYCFACHNVI